MSEVIDIEFSAREVSMTADTTAQMRVTAEEVDTSELLNQIDIADIVEHCGGDSLLDQIGKDKAKEYFSLKETDDE